MIRNALQRFATSLKYSHNRHFCTRSSEVKVSFRKATINDYEGVMKINENFLRGRDPLQEGFHSTVTDPNLSAHLGEVDNQIMTFTCARLLDGGRTLLFMGGRTHASYRGQGLMAQLLHHIKSGYSSNKNILYEMFETEYGHPMLSHPYAQGSSIVLERPIHCFPFRVNDLHLNQLPLNEIQFSIPTQHDLERLLSDTKTHGYLFPGDRIVVNRIPLRAHPQNVPQMTTADVCFHTGESPQECLSFGKSHSCKLGLAYNIDIYGDHPVGLTAHVYKHLQEIAHIAQMRRVHDKGEHGSHIEAQEEVDERVHLLIFASVSVDMREVYEALRTLGINRVEWPVKAQVVLERDFRVD